MRPALLLAVAAPLSACGPPVCGTAEYVLVYDGGEAEMFDADGDGDVDLIERCGLDYGMFGHTRADYGITELTLSPDPHDDSISTFSDMTLYVLPGASVALLTSHFEVGNTVGIESLAGGGLHKIGGTAAETYVTYDLLDGEIEVLQGPRASTGIAFEGSHEWRLRWSFVFGDASLDMELQRWEAEDWVRIGPGIEVGDPLDLPPDWTAPA